MAAYLSGSVSVLSEGVHSMLDVVSSGLSYFTVQEAGKPADREHPYGHGKIETLSSLFEALLLWVAAGLIVYEGAEHYAHPHPMAYQGVAMGVLVASLVVSYVAYRHNLGAAEEVSSSALHVNALHFLSDVVAAAGVLVGLVVMRATGWLRTDAVMAFFVAAYILAISANQARKAVAELSDTQLPDEEVERIRALLASYRGHAGGGIVEAHELRTRKSGATRHVDFHLVTCGFMTVDESHAICDEIEARINEAYPGSSVTIHVEPCERPRTQCQTACETYKRRKVGA